MPHANKDAGQPVHLSILIVAFVVYCLDSIIPIVALPKLQALASFCS